MNNTAFFLTASQSFSKRNGVKAISEVRRVEALHVARVESKVLPASERIEECKNFIERAKKRLTRTEAMIARAHKQKSIFESKLWDGEAKLLQLQSEFEARQEPVGRSVADLQRKIDQVVQERDALKVNSKQLPQVWTTDGVSCRPLGFGSVVDLTH